MKKQYISPLCEEVKLVNSISELQVASPAPIGNVYLPVAHGVDVDVIAD